MLPCAQAPCSLLQVDDSLALMPVAGRGHQCIPQPLQQLFASGSLLGRLACLGAVERPAVGRVLCRKAGSWLDDFICKDDGSANALMAIMRQRSLPHSCSALADDVAASTYAPASEVDAEHPQQVGGAPGMLLAGSAWRQLWELRRRRPWCAGERSRGTALQGQRERPWRLKLAAPLLLQVLRMTEARNLFAGVLDVTQPGASGFVGFGVNLVHLTPAQLQYRTEVRRQRWVPGCCPAKCRARPPGAKCSLPRSLSCPGGNPDPATPRPAATRCASPSGTRR